MIKEVTYEIEETPNHPAINLELKVAIEKLEEPNIYVGDLVYAGIGVTRILHSKFNDTRVHLTDEQQEKIIEELNFNFKNYFDV